MNGGLFADLLDPCAIARSALVGRLADYYGMSREEAKDWLDYEDDLARRLFAIGNEVPRRNLN
jgi:hypothetical protein